MSYGNFKSVSEVARKFDIEVVDDFFIEQKEIKIPELYFRDLTKKLNTSINFINGFTLCETIIRPTPDRLAERYDNLDIWSHVPYNVDIKSGLAGEPDYLVAPRTKYSDMGKSTLSITVAEQEKFDDGWTQALATMVASSVLGADVCYSVVTAGKMWEFGKLENNIFTKHPIGISATSDLQQVFDTLNWLFYKISKMYSK